VVRQRHRSERRGLGERAAKDEECTRRDQGKPDALVPSQRLPEIRRREAGEHDQRDHLLHRLELRRGIYGAAEPIGRNRQAIFDEGERPA